MRGLIGNFALAAIMAGLFTALIGMQVGMALSAARLHSQPVVDAHRPAGSTAGVMPEALHPGA